MGAISVLFYLSVGKHSLERFAGMGVEGERAKDLWIEKEQRGRGPMSISLFTVASGAAICLSVAAIIMQPAGGRSIRS